VDIDVVLAARGDPGATGRVIVVSTTAALVAAIRRQLGVAGKIGRLRIIDSFDGPAAAHPLRSVSELAQLKSLFAAGGLVEVRTQPAGSTVRPGGVQVAGLSGMSGFSGGFGGTGRFPLAQNNVNLSQLSAVLGVRVIAV